MNPRAVTGGPVRAGRLVVLVGAWGLSAAPLWLPDSAAASLGDASRCALAWIPWIALVGLPAGGRAARDWPLALGLALPVVALAAGVDRAAGQPIASLLATTLGGAWAVAWLGEARCAAARGGARFFAPLWLLLIGGLPALAAALAWGEGGGGGGAGSGLAETCARLSPLATGWRSVRPGTGFAESGLGWSVLLAPSSLACLLLWMATAIAAGRERAEA